MVAAYGRTRLTAAAEGNLRGRARLSPARVDAEVNRLVAEEIAGDYYAGVSGKFGVPVAAAFDAASAEEVSYLRETIQKGVRETATGSADPRGQRLPQYSVLETAEDQREQMRHLRRRLDEIRRKYDKFAKMNVSVTAVREALREQRLDILDKQQILRRHAYRVLPAPLRGKALTLIERAAGFATDAGRARHLVKSLAKITEWSDKATRRALYRKVVHEIAVERIRLTKYSARTKSTRTVEANRRMRDYLNELAGYNLAADETVQKGLNWFAQNPDADMPDWMRRGLGAVARGSLKEMSADDLRQIVGNMQSIRRTGRTERDERREAEGIDLEKAADVIVRELRPTGNVTESAVQIATKRRQARRWREHFRRYGWAHIRPERVIEWFAGWDPKSTVKRLVFMPVLRAEAAKYENLAKALEAFKRIHKGIDIAADLSETVVEYQGAKWSMSHLMAVYAHSRTQSGRDHLLGTGLQSADVAFLLEKLPAARKAVVDAMIDYYDNQQYARMNKVFVEEHEVDLPKVDRYFPIQNLAVSRAENAAVLDFLAQHSSRAASVRKKQTVARVKSRAAFTNLSYYDAVITNLQQTEHYIAYNTAVRNVAEVLSHPLVKDAMELRDKGAAEQVHSWLKAVALGRLAPADEGHPGAGIVDRLRTNYVTAVLGFNLVTMLKQPASIAQGLRRIRPAAAAAAAAHYLRRPGETTRFVQEASVMMRNRGTSIEREMAEVAEKELAGRALGTQRSLSTLREWSMRPIQAADKVTTTILWYAKYTEALDSGAAKTVDEARDTADELIRKTQPMGGLVHLPAMYRARGIWRAYTMFTNQPNQNLNLAFETASKRESVRGVSLDVLVNHAVPALLLYMATNGGALPLDDPKGFARSFVGSIVGGFIFVNRLIEACLMGVTGDKRGRRMVRELTPAALTPIVDLSVGAVERDPWKVVLGGSKAAGVPGLVQGRRTVRGVRRLIADETEDPRNLIWSKYILESRRGQAGGGRRRLRRAAPRRRVRRRT